LERGRSHAEGAGVRKAADVALQLGVEGSGGSMSRRLRADLGTEHRTVQQVVAQLGHGVESVRSVSGPRRPTSPGQRAGGDHGEAKWINELEQEHRELRRADEMTESTGERNGPVTFRGHSARKRGDGRDAHARAAADVRCPHSRVASGGGRMRDRLQRAAGGLMVGQGCPPPALRTSRPAGLPRRR
jgi:transposase